MYSTLYVCIYIDTVNAHRSRLNACLLFTKEYILHLLLRLMVVEMIPLARTPWAGCPGIFSFFKQSKQGYFLSLSLQRHGSRYSFVFVMKDSRESGAEALIGWKQRLNRFLTGRGVLGSRARPAAFPFSTAALPRTRRLRGYFGRGLVQWGLRSEAG